MRSRVSNFILLSLLPYPLFATPSLFFTEKEVHLIYQTLSAETAPQQKDLFLTGILYVDTHHWSLWIGKTIITHHTRHQLKDFQIEQVTPFRVTFSWVPVPTAQPIRFTLHPNQLFSSKEKRVISK